MDLSDYIHSIVTALDYIFDDVKEHTLLNHCIERDITRLNALVETRGLPVFTLDFPAAGKHFDKCLSSGTYNSAKGIPHMRSINGTTTIPRLFSGLLLRVFNLDGSLQNEPCTYSVNALRQIYYIGQKVRVECTPERIKSAYDEFVDVDDQLPDPSLDWDSARNFTTEDMKYVSVHSYHRQPELLSLEDVRLKSVFGHVANIMSSVLGFYNPEDERWLPKHGPGAVSDLGKNRYKYDFHHWPDRLESVYRSETLAYANEEICYDSREETPLTNAEHCSKMVYVPKTQKGPRLIAAEPTSHMWCQQGLRRFLESRIKETFLYGMIRINDQTYNQEGARIASIDGKSWTVDLSAASDRLSLRLAERVFKSNLTILNALRASRTLYIYQDLCPEQPAYRKVNKLFTMGNACTFPTQTIVFTAMAIAACLAADDYRIPRGSKDLSEFVGKIRVFGDDIIIPGYGGKYLERLLELFNLKVNRSKTHSSGNFRESCGGDFFHGVDVTPARVIKPFKATGPESLITTIATANNFFKKGYPQLARHIRTFNRSDIPVVGYDSGQIGYIDYTADLRDLSHRIANGQPEVRVLCFSTKRKHNKIHSGAALLQYFIEEPDVSISNLNVRYSNMESSIGSGNWTSGVLQRPSTKTSRRWVPSWLFD